MRLGKKEKNDIRLFLKSELSKIPFDCDSKDRQYIKLDKELLEVLIFDESELYGKCPVWTGEFLRKLDLSEVNFDNVNFDGKSHQNCIDLSYTNAKLDFSKCEDFNLTSCNFSHMDLSCSNINSIHKIDNCDFSYSKANFDFKLLKNSCMTINDSNFEGINFSNFTIEICDLFGHYFKNCNLKDTAINIEASLDTSNKEILKKLGKEIRSGRLGGCYLNGKRILTEGDLSRKKKMASSEYDAFVDDIKRKIKIDIGD